MEARIYKYYVFYELPASKIYQMWGMSSERFTLRENDVSFSHEESGIPTCSETPLCNRANHDSSKRELILLWFQMQNVILK